MNILELFIISIGVAMDAFAVSICKGISLHKIKIKNILKIGLYFSIFQGIMPFLGYFIGINFHHIIESRNFSKDKILIFFSLIILLVMHVQKEIKI